MINSPTFKIFIVLIATSLIFSCSSKKSILKNNYVFQYVDNQDNRPINSTKPQDQYVVYKVNKTIKSEIEDKTSHLILKNSKIIDSANAVKELTVDVKTDEDRVAFDGAIYTHESKKDVFKQKNKSKDLKKYNESFIYTDFKVALQTLTIPLKFRKRIGDGSMIPNQVETGVNIGLAPVVKYSFNVFNPNKKVMGKNTNQYSINGGLLLNLGATDLKGASSAPGITVDRKAATFTYGTFIMFGVNNFNLGYAIGWDNAIGDDASKWVYQNKLWHGLVIALDIIK